MNESSHYAVRIINVYSKSINETLPMKEEERIKKATVLDWESLGVTRMRKKNS